MCHVTRTVVLLLCSFQFLNGYLVEYQASVQDVIWHFQRPMPDLSAATWLLNQQAQARLAVTTAVTGYEVPGLDGKPCSDGDLEPVDVQIR